jgi:hypothetical protein
VAAWKARSSSSMGGENIEAGLSERYSHDTLMTHDRRFVGRRPPPPARSDYS